MQKQDERIFYLFAYVRKKHDSAILTDTPSILSRWEKFFGTLLHVNQSTSHEASEVYTAEPDIPEPSLIEVQFAIEKLIGIDNIPFELIQAGGGKLYEEIYKLIVPIWNKE